MPNRDIPIEPVVLRGGPADGQVRQMKWDGILIKVWSHPHITYRATHRYDEDGNRIFEFVDDAAA